VGAKYDVCSEQEVLSDPIDSTKHIRFDAAFEGLIDIRKVRGATLLD
jgi:hypothetical protein